MKYLVRFVVTAEVLGLAIGFYLQNTGKEILGNKFLGFSALGLAFVVIPLFLIYRFNKSNASKDIFSPTEKNTELEDYIRKGYKGL